MRTTARLSRTGPATAAAALVGATLLALTPTTGSAQDAQPGGEDASVRLIVVLDDQRDADAVVEDVDASTVREMTNLPVVVVEADQSALADLEADPRVVAVMEDIPEPPALANTVPFINGDDVHALGFTGDGTTVAILDTGIDAQHPFYSGRIVSQFCSSTPAASDEMTLCPNGMTTDTGANAANVRDLANCLNGAANICDHGPHVAGIAAGDVAADTSAPATVGNGVAPDAGIIAMQVFTRFTDDADCGGDAGDAPCVLTYPSDQIAALGRLLTLSNDNPTWNIVSANMSLGGGENATACDGDTRKPAIDNLLADGIATVIAAGNDSFMNAVGAPGCISTAFTVGSTGDPFPSVNDTVTQTRNRGTLLDVFAPGNSVSSVPNGAYALMGGTSMSSPLVAGALAVLREAYPSRSLADLMTAITATGVPITYPIDTATPPATHTTPRIDLLAALRHYNAPPTVGVGNATMTVNEGQLAANSGTWSDGDSPAPTLTASSGTVTRHSDGTWSWSEQTSDGPSGSKTVTITATDDKGETASVSFSLVVSNVAPTVTIAAAQVTTAEEGNTVSVTATFSDPGFASEYTGGSTAVTIDFGAGTGGPTPATLAVTPGSAGVATTGTVTGSFAYGDNGTYSVAVSLTDKDGGTGSAGFTLTVDNLDPTVSIDDGDAITFPGGDFVVTSIGDTVSLDATSEDPGSDDLTFTWDDGTTTASTTYFNNGTTAEPDEPPTPTPLGTFPFEATDSNSSTYSTPGVINQGLVVADDDGGEVADAIGLIVTGDHTSTSGQGWWKHQYGGNGRPQITAEFAQGYLDIVNAVSSVFSESTSALTFAEAHQVMSPTGNDRRAHARSELLQAWLEFASGAVKWDSMVPGQGNQPSIGYLDLLFQAETLILDPTATDSQLHETEKALARVQQVK